MGDFNMNKGGSCCGAEQRSNIHEHMDVVDSSGKRVGVVDRVEDETIKLTKKDSPDGRHHRIPFDWIDNVDEQVHLRKNADEVNQEFEAETIGSGA